MESRKNNNVFEKYTYTANANIYLFRNNGPFKASVILITNEPFDVV